MDINIAIDGPFVMKMQEKEDTECTQNVHMYSLDSVSDPR